MSIHHYNPPPFDLFEFDDERLQPARKGRRWFAGWQGAAAGPAEEVTLAWSAPDAGVLVVTSGRDYDSAEARFSAAHLAFAGDALPIAGMPATPGDRHREIERISSAQELWSPGFPLTAESLPSDVAVCDGFTVAHGHIGSLVVLIAAAGIAPGQFKIRAVADWSPYGLDATKSYPISEMNQITGRSG